MSETKKGVAIIAKELDSPLVPVAITGTRDALRKGSFIIRPVHVTVRFGPPIETAGLGLQDRDALIMQARTAVALLLQPQRAA